MENKTVFVIKTVHSVLFLLMVFCLFYVFYIAFIKEYSWTLFAAMSVIAVDGLAIILNRGRCPLTTLAEKYGAGEGAVTHLFCRAFPLPLRF